MNRWDIVIVVEWNSKEWTANKELVTVYLRLCLAVTDESGWSFKEIAVVVFTRIGLY